MQLEQQLYEIPRDREQRQVTYFTTRDLEGLSSSALYTGDLPPMGPGGAGVLPTGEFRDQGDWSLPEYGGVKPAPIKEGSSGMAIVDLPMLNSQMHIHDGAGGSANIKDYGPNRGDPISSYHAAMGDLYAERLSMKRISAPDKSSRKGRT